MPCSNFCVIRDPQPYLRKKIQARCPLFGTQKFISHCEQMNRVKFFACHHWNINQYKLENIHLGITSYPRIRVLVCIANYGTSSSINANFIYLFNSEIWPTVYNPANHLHFTLHSFCTFLFYNFLNKIVIQIN